MKKIELLAPAGKMDTLVGVINAGANAVYLAGKRFGARGLAENFKEEELKKLISYAHIRNVLVYVTVNTLILDSEIDSLLEYTDFLVKENVDAFIIQDIGVISLLKKRYKNQVKLHASTQMNSYSVEQAKMLKTMGIDRIILSREVDIETIKEIKRCVDIELEVFVHGALCVCYSGNCLFSSVMSNRSGNRGLCAQPCRLPFKLLVDGKQEEANKYLLSTKDLMTLEHIGKLQGLVDAVKIEGRLRSFEYAVQSVLSYRKALDNKKINLEEETRKLKLVFNREYTKGFLFGEDAKDIINSYRPNHMGIRIGQVVDYQKGSMKVLLDGDLSLGDGIRILSQMDFGLRVDKIIIGNKVVAKAGKKEIVSIPIADIAKIGDVVLKTLDKSLVESLAEYNNQNFKLIGLDVEIRAYVLEPLKVSLSCGRIKITKEFGIIEEAHNNSSIAVDLDKQFKKLGNTPYFMESLRIDTDGLGFINIGEINEVRRMMIELYESHLNRKEDIKFHDAKYEGLVPKEYDKTMLSAKVETMEQLVAATNLGYDVIYYPHGLEVSTMKHDNLVAYYPRIRHNKALNNSSLLNDLGDLHSNEIRTLIADKTFNVTNAYAYLALRELGVERVTISDELSVKDISSLVDAIRQISGDVPNIEVSIYNNYELMIIKSDIIPNYDETKSYKLVDSKKNQYTVIKDDIGTTKIEFSRKDLTNSIEILKKMGISVLRVEFMNENEREMKQFSQKLHNALF